MDEPFFEAHVLGVPEAAVRVQRRRVVGPDVQHDLVAGPEQIGGDSAGDRGGEATTAIIGVGQHVPDDGQTGGPADDVGPGGRHEMAVDAQPVVDPVAKVNPVGSKVAAVIASFPAKLTTPILDFALGSKSSVVPMSVPKASRPCAELIAPLRKPRPTGE